MSRKKRVWYPGATYHVMSRGNRHVRIFDDAADYRLFLEYMLQIREKHRYWVHSICLMTNHFHIAIETEDDKLSRIMQKVLSLYAEEYNHRHHFSGHLFESRYTAKLIEDERYFLEVSRYIHLNPVKAQMVCDPLAYEYSSYPLFVDPLKVGCKTSGEANEKLEDRRLSGAGAMISKLVTTQRVLDAFGFDSKEQYRIFVESRNSHAEQEQQIQNDIKEDDMWLPR